MPTLRKLSAPEIAALEQPTPGPRALLAQEYDAYVAYFLAGEYGRVDLEVGERRAVVRARLHVAARRRGLALRFRPGPGPALIFHMEAAPAPRPVRLPAKATQSPSGVASGRAASLRSSQRRQSSTERYSDVLPRWMRQGRPSGQRGGSKRRTR